MFFILIVLNFGLLFKNSIHSDVFHPTSIPQWPILVNSDDYHLNFEVTVPPSTCFLPGTLSLSKHAGFRQRFAQGRKFLKRERLRPSLRLNFALQEQFRKLRFAIFARKGREIVGDRLPTLRE